MHALRPDWPAPARVRAAVSLRGGGASVGSFASLNLGTHVGDDPAAVAENRRRLRAGLALPAEPLWLSQLHGTGVIDADRPSASPASPAERAGPLPGDAAITRTPGQVLAVLVADCLPVLFARHDGGAVAIAHAGWRGLAGGVLEATVAALQCPGQELQAWLGPAIGPEHFEVGAEVRSAFVAHAPGAAAAFTANTRGRWQCDLYRLARQRLAALGLSAVHGQPRCTYTQARSFYSYRRDRVTGRMAALIWLAS